MVATLLKAYLSSQGISSNQYPNTDHELSLKIEESLSPSSPTDSDKIYALPSNAVASSLNGGYRLSELEVTGQLNLSNKDPKQDKGFIFLDSLNQKFMASKLGLDHKHHFLNSFLVDYHPFEVKEFWMPHQVLSMRLKYQLDKEQFAGFQEIWLSSYESYRIGRGDCEDHSIALADWLIGMGEDARVVVGTHKGQGHAWVVVIRPKGTFLLESTSKKKRRLWSNYPLASLAQGYVPEAMFDRDYYWISDQSGDPSDYSGPQWLKTGRIHR
uniref:transglutaminase-like cysteine peptidase n=1 Tax=Pelagicoccus albus TaxID=415222 RepID=UPI001C8C6066|nr:transglutaminase-like cysteine peptidase [Pelagicoccus albus]